MCAFFSSFSPIVKSVSASLCIELESNITVHTVCTTQYRSSNILDGQRHTPHKSKGCTTLNHCTCSMHNKCWCLFHSITFVLRLYSSLFITYRQVVVAVNYELLLNIQAAACTHNLQIDWRRKPYGIACLTKTVCRRVFGVYRWNFSARKN